MKDEIYRIAKNARKWSERNARKNDYFYDDLGCFCAIASSYLSQKLHQAGIENKIAIHKGKISHCFVKTDEYIIDITATQFNLPQIKFFNNVEVVNQLETNIKMEHLTKLTDLSIWKVNKTVKNYLELLEYQRENYWPIMQRIDGHPELNKYF